MRVLQSRAVWALALVVWLPAWVPHEALHALVAAPFASIDLRLSPRPYVEMHFREDAPSLAITLACLAPTLVGLVAAPAVLQTVGMPGTIIEGWLLVCFGMFTAPSRQDISGALLPVRRRRTADDERPEH